MPSAERSAAAPPADLPNGEMVQRFDSYLYRTRAALPAPAQAEVDPLSAILPSLKQTLERVDTFDPNAQDARRLMSIHLPGLIERYSHVPAAYRSEKDGEGKTADERLVEALAASRAALGGNVGKARPRRSRGAGNPGPLHPVALRRRCSAVTAPADRPAERLADHA